jgi:glucosylceramidase
MKQAVLISTTQNECLTNGKVHISKEKSYHTLELSGESYQTMEGFGGCFNELGYIALNVILLIVDCQ